MTNLIGSGLNLLCLQSHSKPECRWTWPEVAILGADQKERGLWGRKCEFRYKGVNLFLKELKNVTIILYSNTRTVQIAEFPEISHLLNQHRSSFARHVNATSRKSLEIQAWSIT